MNKSINQLKDGRDRCRPRLMIRGVLAVKAPRHACAVVERGMPILSREGREVGKVAAVSVNEGKAVEAILLSRLPLKMEYRIVPADLIAAVRDHQILLDLAADGVDDLGEWPRV